MLTTHQKALEALAAFGLHSSVIATTHVAECTPTPEMASLQDITTEALHDLGAEINAINRANGWAVITPEEWRTEKYKVPGVLALIHSEVSEALEAFRHNDPANFREELADVFIRLMDLSHGLGIDLAEAVFAKLEKNRGRGFRHGGKVV